MAPMVAPQKARGLAPNRFAPVADARKSNIIEITVSAPSTPMVPQPTGSKSVLQATNTKPVNIMGMPGKAGTTVPIKPAVTITPANIHHNIVQSIYLSG